MNDKLTAILRLYVSATIPGEKAAAKGRATILAEREGLTFDAALKIHQGAAARPSGRPPNFMDGFAEWMEEREPGYKDQRAREKAEKVEAWRVRRAAILARYGSEDAALAPCWREKAIHDALGPLRVVNHAHRFMPGRWTRSIDGWENDFPGPPIPDRVRSAIAGAYPMPSTFDDGMVEHAYWEARNREMEDVICQDGDFLGDACLDLAAQARADMIRRLVEWDMPISTLSELHRRFGMHLDAGMLDWDHLQSIYDDLGGMMEREARARDLDAAKPSDNRPSLDGSIRAALKADPSRSDRSVAREVGCSPTTVGSVRKAMDLSSVRRSVQRGGQRYAMRAKAAPSGDAASRPA